MLEYGARLESAYARHRTLPFKDMSAHVEYDHLFGSGNAMASILSTVVRRAEGIALADMAGPRPRVTVGKILGVTGELPSGVLTKPNERAFASLLELTGELNHPVDELTARRGKTIRNWFSAALLWKSTISSLTDMGNFLSTMRGVSGGRSGIRDLSAAIKAYASNKEFRPYLEAQGACLDTIVASMSRMDQGYGGIHRFADNAAEFTLRYSGQQGWQRVMQGAWADFFTRHMADLLDAEPGQDLFRISRLTGLTPEDLEILKKSIRDIAGQRRVSVDDVQQINRDTAARYRNALTYLMDFALIQPGPTERAIVTLGTKAGTLKGETVRLLMQYKTYPLAMRYRTLRRISSLNEGRWYNPATEAGMEYYMFAGQMAGLALAALMIKDTLNGREPMNPLDPEDWTAKNGARILIQTGVGAFSMFESLTSFGPAFGVAGDAVLGAATGDANKVGQAFVSGTPFLGSMPVISGTVRGFVHSMTESTEAALTPQ